MAKQRGRGGTINCAKLTAKYKSGGGAAIKEMLHAKNSIDWVNPLTRHVITLEAPLYDAELGSY